MNTEDLIREALAKQADRAPAPGAVLAALHRPPRRRALVLAVAAVVGVLVVGAGAFVLRERQLTEPVPPAAAALPIRYSPNWLPAGYLEQARGYTPDGTVSRTWLPAPLFVGTDSNSYSGPLLAMSYRPDREDLDRHDVIGGVTGHYYANEGRGSVQFVWTPDQSGIAVTVTVDQVPDSRAVLDQVVRSVRPDPATTPVPLLMNSGPHDVRGTPDDWRVEAFDSRWEGSPYTAELSSHRPYLAGAPATVRGLPGIVGEDGVAVQLAPDRWLAVRSESRGAIPRDALIAIANGAQVDLYPDMSWLGRH
jgi:hypothetical protein